jgi:hypothetical protein
MPQMSMPRGRISGCSRRRPVHDVGSEIPFVGLLGHDANSSTHRGTHQGSSSRETSDDLPFFGNVRCTTHSFIAQAR